MAAWALALAAVLLAATAGSATAKKFIVTSPTVVVSTGGTLLYPPWFSQNPTNFTWVQLLFPEDVNGAALTNFAAPTPPVDSASCASGVSAANQGWISQPGGFGGVADPFNFSPFTPFSAEAGAPWVSENRCTGFSPRTSTASLTLAQGDRSIEIVYGADIGFLAGSNGVANLLELFIVDSSVSSPTVPLVQYASRNTSAVPSGYTTFPTMADPPEMVNVGMTLTISGPATFQYGFRSRSTAQAFPDQWFMTRMFFGCVGPVVTRVSNMTIGYNATSVFLQSQVQPRNPFQLPNGATVGEADVRWTISYAGTNTDLGTGFDKLLSVGGPGNDVVVTTSQTTRTVNFRVITSKGCFLTRSIILTVLAAPRLSPVNITGAPSAPVSMYPVTINLASAPANAPFGPATYAWNLTCNGTVTQYTTANISFTAGPGAQVDPFSPPGNKVCTVTVSVGTPIQGTATSATTTITFLAGPTAAFSGAPYSVTTSSPATVQLSAASSTCINVPCNATFVTSCPGRPAVTKSSPSYLTPVTLTAGAGGDIDPSTTPVITAPTTCTVTLAVTDAAGVTSTATTNLTVQPPIIIPPGGITGVPGGVIGGPYPRNVTVGANVTGVIGTPNYTWSIACPPGSAPPKATGSSPNFTFSAGVGQQVDPFTPTYGTLPCAVSVSVCTPTQGCAPLINNITVLPTPIPVTSGPYVTGPPFPSAVTLNGTGTTCNVAPCSYTWTVTCPGSPPVNVTKTGLTAVVTVGSGAQDIPPPASGTLNCTVGLTVVDSAAPPQTASISSTLSVLPAPVFPPTNPITGINADGTITGPYPRNVTVAANVTGFVSPPTYNWSIACAGAVKAAQTSPSTSFTFSVGSGQQVDPFNPYDPLACVIAVTACTASQGCVAAAINATVLPTPIASAGGPYSASPPFPKTVTLNGTASKCGAVPCSYLWQVVCPGITSVNKTGPLPMLGVGPGLDVDPGTTSVNCTVSLVVTDGIGFTSSAQTMLMVTPAITVPPGGISGLPPGGVIGGPYPVNITLGINATGLVGPATYNWSIVCPPGSAPPKVTQSGSSSNLTFSVGSAQQVDPFAPFGTLPCTVAVDVCTAAQGCITSGFNATVLPTPVVANNGPFVALPPFPTTVVLTANGTKCNVALCTYSWTVTCPGSPPVVVTKTGMVSNVIVGPGADIAPPTTGTLNCTVGLTVVDSAAPPQNASISTTLSVLPAPVFPPTNPITGINADGTITGPYPRNVTVAANITGFISPPTYNWSISCAGAVKATQTSPSANFTFSVGSGQQVDPFNPYDPLACVIAVTACTASQGCVAAAINATVLPTPIASAGGPYFAPSPFPKTVSLNGTASKCGAPPCDYTWTVACPASPAIIKTGATASVTVGPGLDIVPPPTGTINCSVGLVVTDKTALNGSAATTLSVTAQVVIPPGGIGGLPPGGTILGPYPKNVTLTVNATGFIDPPTYNWTITCPQGAVPPKVTQVGSSSNLTFGIGAGLQVDPFTPFGPLLCDVTVSACTATQGCATGQTNATIIPTPIPVTIGPYVAPPPYPTTVLLDANGSLCGSTPCTYKWVVTCPGKAPIIKNTAVANVTVGPGQEVVPPTNCSVSLTVTDSLGQNSTVTTSLSATEQLIIPPGGILGLPQPPGSNYGGPYPVLVNVSVNATGITTPPNYTWELRCPAGSSPPKATATTPILSYWVGANYSVDPFNPYGNVPCQVTVSVASGGQNATATANVTYLAPPVPATNGPYAAGPIYPQVVTLDATASGCANPSCSFKWTISCPDGRSAVVNGIATTALIADTASATINPVKPTPIVTPQNCSVVLTVNDSGVPWQSANVTTFLTLLPPGPQLTIIGGPFNISAGQVAQFTGSANCTNPPCVYGWVATCPPFAGQGSQTANAAGINASMTTGPNNGTIAVYQINTFGMATAVKCNVSFSGTDVNTLTTTVYTSLTITPAPPLCGGTNLTIIIGNPTTARPASPSNIRASTNGAICTAKRAVRRGNSQKASQVVFIPGFNDPQGFAVIPVVTGVITNNAERICRCRPTSTDNCRCVPDATVLPGGTGASLMPGVSPRPGGFRGRPGRVFLLRFNATSANTQLACEGFAQVCVIKQRANLRGKAPPACVPFNNAVTVRDATRCANVSTSVQDGSSPEQLFADLGI